MDTTDYILGGIGIAALIYGYNKYSGGTTSTPKTTVKPVYVSDASWSAIKADSNRQAFRTPDATPESGAPHGEWDSIFGTFHSAFPNLDQPGGMLSNSIMAWFKGLDLNPVHNQGYAVTYKADIQRYQDQGLAPTTDWSLVPTGSYRTAQGISGIYGYGAIGDITECGCLG